MLIIVACCAFGAAVAIILAALLDSFGLLDPEKTKFSVGITATKFAWVPIDRIAKDGECYFKVDGRYWLQTVTLTRTFSGEWKAYADDNDPFTGEAE